MSEAEAVTPSTKIVPGDRVAWKTHKGYRTQGVVRSHDGVVAVVDTTGYVNTGFGRSRVPLAALEVLP